MQSEKWFNIETSFLIITKVHAFERKKPNKSDKTTPKKPRINIRRRKVLERSPNVFMVVIIALYRSGMPTNSYHLSSVW